MPNCKHRWVVTSTALQNNYIIVECDKCLKCGVARNPTDAEWIEAYHRSKPFSWGDVSGVVEVDEPPTPVNSIIHGDCVDVMTTLPDECVDLILTSPPYDSVRTYGGNEFDAEAVIKCLKRITKPGGIVAWVVQDMVRDGSLSGSSNRQVEIFKSNGWTWHDEIILARHGRRHPATHRRYGPSEKAFIFSKGRPMTVNMLRDRKNKTAGQKIIKSVRNGDTLVRTPTETITAEYGFRLPVWTYSAGGRLKDLIGDHPAVMPEKIAEDLIQSFSNPGDLVLDPMCGAGTTCKVAMLKHRRFLGVEIHEPYVEIAKERIMSAAVTSVAC